MGYGTGDKNGVFTWEPATNKYTEVFRHADVDVSSVLTGPNNEVYAVRYHDHYPSYHYPDSEHPLARAHAGVAKAFPSSDARFVNFSDDAKKGVLLVTGPQQPAEFMLVDIKKKLAVTAIEVALLVVGGRPVAHGAI